MKRSLLVLTLICMVFACRKPLPDNEVILPNIDVVDDPVPDTTTTGHHDTTAITNQTQTGLFPVNGNYNCPNSPNYGSDVLYARWIGTRQNDLVSPQNNPGAGKYYAWPKGIVIDSTTGTINITRSETGIRYVIGSTKAGTQDTCLKTIILGGITYIDSIYVLSNNDTLARPYYNANPLQQAVCDESGDNDYPGLIGGLLGALLGHGNSKCEFDDDDDNDGHGAGDEPPPGQQANAKKIRVRTISGIINLKRTLADGAFGSNPQNGDTRTASIYYRLNDGSAKVLQKINIEITYYNRRSDIPPAVVNEINTKRNEFYQGRIISPNGKPRPPQIIITRFAN